jgi:bifunctional non-homologous end joining protein LigD
MVITRYPDGIEGKSFFQHNAPGFAPGWIRTERFWSESTQREVDYFVCDDEESLLYVINLGTIPLHIWGSRIETMQQPDWASIDLDPAAGAPFDQTVTLALALRALADEIGLPSFVKTSGQSGLHVLFPMGGLGSWENARAIAELISRVIAAELPQLATTERVIQARGGRILLDYFQNSHGRTLVSPFSVRPKPGATVSTPLDWSEVASGLDPTKLNIKSVVERVNANGDPMAPLLTTIPDFAKVLSGLEARMKRANVK